jgi:hypothetical protein
MLEKPNYIYDFPFLNIFNWYALIVRGGFIVVTPHMWMVYIEQVHPLYSCDFLSSFSPFQTIFGVMILLFITAPKQPKNDEDVDQPSFIIDQRILEF